MPGTQPDRIAGKGKVEAGVHLRTFLQQLMCLFYLSKGQILENINLLSDYLFILRGHLLELIKEDCQLTLFTEEPYAELLELFEAGGGEGFDFGEEGLYVVDHELLVTGYWLEDPRLESRG